MVKVTLEKEDIEELIKAKYREAEIIGDPLKDIEIEIRVKNFVPPRPEPQAPPKQTVLTDGGSIDANASGLTLEPRKQTKPGGAMGRERGNMPLF